MTIAKGKKGFLLHFWFNAIASFQVGPMFNVHISHCNSHVQCIHKVAVRQQHHCCDSIVSKEVSHSEIHVPTYIHTSVCVVPNNLP
jgi:hypothetical protein